MTETDNYRLTPAGKRLYLVMIDPEHVGKSVTDICEIAEISRDTYYRFMKEEGFVNLVKDTSLKLVESRIGDVVNATYKYSLSERGHSDRKLLLTMAGLYKDKVETTVDGAIDVANVSSRLQSYLLEDENVDGEDSGVEEEATAEGDE